MAIAPRTDQDYKDALSELGEPFARALAVFVRECGRAHSDDDARQELPERQVLGKLEPFEELDSSLRERLNEIVDADVAADEAGTLEKMEFTADSPAQAAAKRLRQAMSVRGITQKQLATSLGVWPSVISRVLQNPDRSKVRTLRRIGSVLGVELREIL